MMNFYRLNNFSLSAFYLICHGYHNLFCNKGMSKEFEKLVVELSKEMGTSDHIELVKDEDYIRESEAAWVYV